VAKRVAGKVKVHLAARRARVVVCIDREQRTECAGAFATAVLRALRSVLRREEAAVVDIVVADRAMEAWILADAAGLHVRGLFKAKLKIHCFEGELGERGRKGIVELERLLGRPYEKTRDGPFLFSRLDFAAARAHGTGMRGSKSLDKLLRTLRL
jgi:hypothetical protein